MKRGFLILSIFFLNLPLISKDIEIKIKEDLVLFKDIMDYFLMDDGFYPEEDSIEALAEEIIKRQYAESLNIKDPYGRFYKVNSIKNHYKISTEDGKYFVENGIKSFGKEELKENVVEEILKESISYPKLRS